MSEVKQATLEQLGIYHTLAAVGDFVAKDLDGFVYVFDYKPSKRTTLWGIDRGLSDFVGFHTSLSPLIQDTPWDECLFEIVEV